MTTAGQTCYTGSIDGLKMIVQFNYSATNSIYQHYCIFDNMVWIETSNIVAIFRIKLKKLTPLK